MKKILITGCTLILLLGLNGCLSTLHPFFTVKDLVADNRLTGSWSKAKDGTTTTFRKAQKKDLEKFSEALQQNADKIYIAKEDSGSGTEAAYYYAFLLKLGNSYYMDTYPFEINEAENADAFYKAHYIPLHAIYRVYFNSTNGFELKPMDGNYLEKLIRNKQIRIKHEIMPDGDYLVTAGTEELQQYLLKYGDVPDAYDNNNTSVYTKLN
jgi:hypothetical protein